MVIPTFTFRSANTTRGLIAAGEGSTEFLHPLLPTCLRSSNGFMVVMNGWNLNRRLADVTGYNGAVATAVELLQMRAPRQPLLPATTSPGVGRVYGREYFWRYRWYDSRTGEHSGLSPLPAWRVNLGTSQPPGGSTYLGQNAIFAFSVSDAPAHADTLQLFRNTSQQFSLVYLVESVSIFGLTTVQIVDDNTDDELFFRESVSLADGTSPSGFTWEEGLMPPLAKAWRHPSTRMFYFGLRRFGRSFAGASGFYATITQGDDLATISNPAGIPRIIEPGRVGQRVRFYATADLADQITDPTVYRIVKVESAFTFRIYPELAVSSDVASGTSVQLFFSIDDDRDARFTYMGEPGKPWLIDPRKTIAAGDDYSDGVMAWFTLPNGINYCHTQRRIYAFLNDFTADPSLSGRFTQVAAEGMVGFDSGCETPFGWVFVNEKLRVRIFDGTTTRPLDRDSGPLDDFLAETQFDRIEPSMMEETRCYYDPTNHAVVVSYVPVGGSALRETLTFYVGDRVWRGPNRERVSCAGTIRTTSAEDTFVIGDDMGNLLVREEQVLDVVPTTASALTGTVTSAQTRRIFTDSGATFAAESDERLRGSPIIFLISGIYYLSFIADVLSGTQLELTHIPDAEDGSGAGTIAAGNTYAIGTIRWDLITAYLDGGEPALPKTINDILVRFKLGTATTTFEVGCAEDANNSYSGQRLDSTTKTAPTADVLSAVYARMALVRNGVTFQIRFRGSSRTGDPQIGQVVVPMIVGQGVM